jgi:hypothetical protein
MRRGLVVLLVAAATVGCAAGSEAAAIPGAADDVRLFMSELERIHPDPYHATPREEFHRRSDELAARASTLERQELVVELMRRSRCSASATATPASIRFITTRRRSTSTPSGCTGSRTGWPSSPGSAPARSSWRSKELASTSSSGASAR